MSYRLTVYVSSLIDLHSAEKERKIENARIYIYKIYIYTHTHVENQLQLRVVLRYVSFLSCRGMERVLWTLSDTFF